MKLRGKHVFAIILFLIGIAFTIYITMPAHHKDHSGLSCPVQTKTITDTTHKPDKGTENGPGS